MTHPGGRPSKYTKALGEKICRAVSTSTDGLKKICDRHEDFPEPKTIYEWRIDYPEFGEMFTHAKRTQAEILAEEIKDIADGSEKDTITKFDKEGNEIYVCNKEWVARSRLRVDTYKWLACKLAPKLYGEKTENKQTVVLIKHEDALKELE